MIHFDPFEPVRLRAEAARALFEANGVDVIEYVQGDPEDSTGFASALVGDLLAKYPKGELDAIWAGWDASALGGTGTHMSSQISTCSVRSGTSVAVKSRSGPNGTSVPHSVIVAPRRSSPGAKWRRS